MAGLRGGRGRAGSRIQRWRLGWPGTEPREVRNPAQRWGAQLLALAGLLVISFGSTEAGALLVGIAVVVGVPRPWVWANDRVSALAWSLGVAALLAGEAIWALGGPAARVSLTSRGHAGAAALLLALCPVFQALSYLRRWGTEGNDFYRYRALRRGDPAAIENQRRRNQRGG